MRGIIFGAVLGAMALVGCQSGGAVATRGSPAVMDKGPATQNPHSFERGLTVQGNVETDYKDMLVIDDQWGQKRYLRISSQTRYFQDGKRIGREFLAPGSTVRASFDDNNRETIAREIHIVSSESIDAPVQLPSRDGRPIP